VHHCVYRGPPILGCHACTVSLREICVSDPNVVTVVTAPGPYTVQPQQIQMGPMPPPGKPINQRLCVSRI